MGFGSDLTVKNHQRHKIEVEKLIAFKSFNQNISLSSLDRLIRSTRKNSDQPKNLYIHTIFIYINVRLFIMVSKY